MCHDLLVPHSARIYAHMRTCSASLFTLCLASAQVAEPACHDWVAAQVADWAQAAPCKRRRPLVLVAGEGKTGTTSVAYALASLGLTAGHSSGVYRCSRRPRPGRPCEGEVVEDRVLSRRYDDLRVALKFLESGSYDSHDFCQFDFLDAVADVPIPQLFPFIYEAHGSDTRVILTVRNATQWVQRRMAWNSGRDLAPMGWVFGHSLAELELRSSRTQVGVVARRSLKAAAWAYLAEAAMVMCTVPPDRLLVLDVFRKHSGISLLQRLATLLWGPGRATNLNASARFPHIRPLLPHVRPSAVMW